MSGLSLLLTVLLVSSAVADDSYGFNYQHSFTDKSLAPNFPGSLDVTGVPIQGPSHHYLSSSVVDKHGFIWQAYAGQSTGNGGYLAVLAKVDPKNGTILCTVVGSGMDSGGLAYHTASHRVAWSGDDWAPGVYWVNADSCDSEALNCPDGGECYNGGSDFVVFGDAGSEEVVVSLLSYVRKYSHDASTKKWSKAWDFAIPSPGLYAAQQVGGMAASPSAEVVFVTLWSSGYPIEPSNSPNSTDVYALDVKSGKTLWHTTWHYPQFGVSSGISSPVVSDKVVMVSHDHMQFAGLSADTGAKMWERNQSAFAMYDYQLLQGDVAVFQWQKRGSDGFIDSAGFEGLDVTSGDVAWTTKFASSQNSYFPIGLGSTAVYLTAGSMGSPDTPRQVMQLDPTSGNVSVLSTLTVPNIQRGIPLSVFPHPASNSVCSILTYTGASCYPVCLVCL